jgi:hypothetical protein
MFYRASPFAAFRLILQAPLRTARAMQALAALAQSTMDRIDPVIYGPWVTSPPDFIEGSPAERRVLMHIGLGDASVPNLASWHHARALGLPLLEPSPEPIYGLEAVTAPHDGSALVVFDFGIAEPRPGTIADLDWPSNDVHEGVRRTVAGQAQANAFLAPDGLVLATCDGPCDPE